jgi:hypothetical protein
MILSPDPLSPPISCQTAPTQKQPPLKKSKNKKLTLVFLRAPLYSASSLGMMSEEEKKMQRIEDIKELLS